MTSPDFYNALLTQSTVPSVQAESQTPSADTVTKVEKLIDLLKSSHTDITANYNDWLKVGFALASEFGESGRRYFHDISSINQDYSQTESDIKYTECLKSENGRTDISTLFYLAKNKGITPFSHDTPKHHTSSGNRQKGQSDKNVPLTLSEEDPEEMPPLPMFPEDIFHTLPGLLQKITSLMHTPQECSLILIGSIATLSSALLPMKTIYFGKTIYPNMYLFVPGPARAGKGKLDFCFRLVKPIHEKLERWNIAKDEYKKEYARYTSASAKARTSTHRKSPQSSFSASRPTAASHHSHRQWRKTATFSSLRPKETLLSTPSTPISETTPTHSAKPSPTKASATCGEETMKKNAKSKPAPIHSPLWNSGTSQITHPRCRKRIAVQIYVLLHQLHLRMA